MTDEELAIFFGNFILENWEYIFGSIGSLLVGCIALSWLVSNKIHKSEVAVLRLEITHQKERFSQFESIMEQRIESIKFEADLLKSKMHPAEVIVQENFHQSAGVSSTPLDLDSNQNSDMEYRDIPAFLRGSAPEDEDEETNGYKRASEIIEKSDAVNNIIRGLNL